MRRRLPKGHPERHPATAHLFIINPLSGARMDNLFATHPSTENRIAALRQMQGRGPASPRPASVAVPRVGRTGPAAERPRGPWS